MRRQLSLRLKRRNDALQERTRCFEWEGLLRAIETGFAASRTFSAMESNVWILVQRRKRSRIVTLRFGAGR
jgi:hypothetical protein